jgi:hypothetical protein
VGAPHSCTYLCTRPTWGAPRKRLTCMLVVPFGAVAQLGEHLLCKQGVAGSIPVRSTCYINALQWFSLLGFFLSMQSVVSCVVSIGPKPVVSSS